MTAKKIVYIIGRYPLLTTTFIDREIMKLKQWGVDLTIFSIRQPPEDTPLSSFQIELKQQVKYLLPVNVWQLIFSQIFFSVLHPRRFFGTLVYLLTREHPNFNAMLKTILHFGEGVYFAYLLRDQEIDEVHAHFLDRAALLALVAKRLLEIPYSLSIHAGADIYVNPTLIFEKLQEARQAVTCTHFNKTHLKSLIGSSLAEKIIVVPHGLNPQQFAPDQNLRDENLLLAVGQLKMRKGFFELIEACKSLRDQNFDFKCEIIGGGSLFGSLQEKITAYSLEDHVSLTGALPNEEVLERLKKATLFVMPCKVSENGDVDGIPNVLLESMAMTVPVISTRISAIPELISDQENGLLVNPNSHDELVKAIISLINSPEKRAQLGNAGRKKVLADFNIDTNIDRFANTLWPELFVSD